jgi:FixJ family two-component response regulator
VSATVFIVDDDASFLKATARLLDASGYEARTFASAAEFLRAVTPEARGCLLLDLQMPGMNGLELQEMIVGCGIAMPIIFLTGQGDIPTTVHAMRRGAEDFLTKMAPAETLLAAIERALAREARERRTHERLSELRRFGPRHPRPHEQTDRRRPRHQRAHRETAPHQHHPQNANAIGS